MLLEAVAPPASHLVACHFRGAGALGEAAVAELPADWGEGSDGLGPLTEPAPGTGTTTTTRPREARVIRRPRATARARPGSGPAGGGLRCRARGHAAARRG